MTDKLVLMLGDDGRVLGAAWYRTPPDGAVIVPREALPEGNVTQYRYEGGAFVHDPLPEPEPETPEPTAEERITALEEALELLLSGVTE